MTARVRALIVDDEPLARRTIEDLLRADSGMEICGSCANGESAVAAVERERPDLLFLDIQMPEMNGFEVLETLVERIGSDALPFVIFVTAYDRFALRAFEYRALDYLLKPFSDERFAQALERAKKEIARNEATDIRQKLAALLRDYQQSEAKRSSAGGRFNVRSGKKVTFLDLSDIVWFEAADHYVLVHTERQSHLCRESMSALEARLDSDRFLRIHRSAIVNVSFIDQLLDVVGDEYNIRLRTGKTLSVSRRRSKVVKKVLGL
jgi:two-component system LytT family response regulator